MEEKALTKGIFSNNKISTYGFLIGIASFIVGAVFCASDNEDFGILLQYSALLEIAVAIIFLLIFGLGKYEMFVTDKRVYGKVRFGRRVDLPLDSITAIGLGMFNSIAVTTASGAIKFVFMKNRDSVYNIISALILDRQKQSSPIENQHISASTSADELQKFKNLLDNGTITQEEFDAKKKQLLGL